jgi:hypothetical protein
MRLFKVLRALLLLTAALLVAQSAQAEVRRLRVEHYLQPSATGGGRLCYVVSDGAVAQLLEEPIIGFQFEWGTVYQITVNIDLVGAAGGGARPRYSLVSVDSATRVAEGTRFEMYLFDKSFIQKGTILRQKAFTCASPLVEEELKRRLTHLGAPLGGAAGKQQPLEDGRKVLLEFSHPKTAAEPLILQSVTSANDLKLD